MNTDPTALTGTRSAPRPAATGRGKAADSTAAGERAGFGRELARSTSARRADKQPAPSHAERGVGDTREPPAKAVAERSAAPANARRQGHPNTAGRATPPAEAGQLRAPIPAAQAQTAETQTAEPHARRNQRDPSHADAKTRDAVLALIAPNLAAAQRGAAQSAGVRGVRPGVDQTPQAARSNAGQDSNTPAKRLAKIQATSAQTAAGKHRAPAANNGLESASIRDTLTQKHGDAPARPTPASARASFMPLSSEAGAHASALHAGVLSPNTAAPAGTQSGPNAAIAGGAAGQPAPAPGASIHASIGAPLGSDGWSTALGQHSLRLASGGNRQARIQLYPRELGQINISVTIDGHNQAQLHLASPHAHVRDAVEAALPQLKQSLAAGGLALGQASVGDQGSQAAFGQTDAHGGESGRGERAPDGAPTIEAIGEAEPAPVARALAGLRGGIDIFA